MPRIAILGATGYTALELIKILVRHPEVEITALTHRRRPIYHAINGYGRETVMLRKYVLEASLLNVLKSAVPIVVDAEMTAGGPAPALVLDCPRSALSSADRATAF